MKPEDQPSASPPRQVRLVFLLGGQVLIGNILGPTAPTLKEDGVLLLTPREIMVTPQGDSAEVSLIPMGHIAGLPFANIQKIFIQRSQYLAICEVEDKRLEESFLKNQNDHQSF